MKSASETYHVSEADELEWLKRQAENIVHQTIAVADPPFPENEIDEVYMHHRAVLHMGFLYNNLCGAIRLEDLKSFECGAFGFFICWEATELTMPTKLPISLPMLRQTGQLT